MNDVLERILQLKGSQSTASFARTVGLNQQTMDRYIKGREPPIGVIQKLCSVYEVSADWLLGLPERGKSAAPPTSASKPPDCASCKFKRFAEAFKAIQAPI